MCLVTEAAACVASTMMTIRRMTPTTIPTQDTTSEALPKVLAPSGSVPWLLEATTTITTIHYCLRRNALSNTAPRLKQSQSLANFMRCEERNIGFRTRSLQLQMFNCI